MAVQKLHEFCEAEKRKIFSLRKIIVQGKTRKKFDRLAKYIYYIEIRQLRYIDIFDKNIDILEISIFDIQFFAYRKYRKL
jgi:hypothetical protein